MGPGMAQTAFTSRAFPLVLALALCMTACSQSIESIVDEALREVESAGDPIAALQRLDVADRLVDETCQKLPMSVSTCRQAGASLLAKRYSVMEAAAKVGDPQAIRRIFENDNLLATQQKLMPMVLALADGSVDPHILFAAAKIVGGGKLRTRDVVKQVYYLTKAWSHGDKPSAGALATVAESLGDHPNAYLWSLRCSSGCSRERPIELAALEANLKSGDIASIQRLAADAGALRVQ